MCVAGFCKGPDYHRSKRESDPSDLTVSQELPKQHPRTERFQHNPGLEQKRMAVPLCLKPFLAHVFSFPSESLGSCSGPF